MTGGTHVGIPNRTPPIVSKKLVNKCGGSEQNFARLHFLFRTALMENMRLELETRLNLPAGRQVFVYDRSILKNNSKYIILIS